MIMSSLFTVAIVKVSALTKVAQPAATATPAAIALNPIMAFLSFFGLDGYPVL
jgi:hypothetical protein